MRQLDRRSLIVSAAAASALLAAAPIAARSFPASGTVERLDPARDALIDAYALVSLLAPEVAASRPES